MTSDALRLVCRAQIAKGNRAWVEELEDRALAKLLKGGGEIAPLESGSLNGKSVQRNVRMDAAEVAAVCRVVLDDADAEAASGAAEDIGPGTGFDFSRTCPL
jgi:hypothetical protein